jgi:xanthine dehydrogenase accessory factor
MRDILPDLDRWHTQNHPIALATVIQTWGSAPRGVGAKMALTASGEMAGSVSGGCVEGAVMQAGLDVLKTSQPQLLHFGVADETAWEVGLACGGTIEVFVQTLDPKFYDALHAALNEDRPAASVTLIRGPKDFLGRQIFLRDDDQHIGSLGDRLDETALAEARAALTEGKSRRFTVPESEAEPIEFFIEVLLPAPTLIVIGGVHIALALVTLAKTLDYRTVVVDPRKAFGSEARFPTSRVDRLVQSWPDEALTEIGLTRSTAVATLTHDPKLDDPALKIALPSPAFYVGALGSRQTQARRRERLLAQGLSETHVARLRGPIGLNLGARTPEEIALSIIAEVVAARNGQM